MDKLILKLSRSLFEVLSQINGFNFQTETYLVDHSKRIEKTFKDIPVSHLSRNFLFNDLRTSTARSPKQVFLGNSYGASNADIAGQLKTNLGFYFSLSLSYSYELFETYIRRTTQILSDHHPNDFFSNVRGHELKGDKKKTFENINSKNNDTYFKILRRLLPEFKKHEQTNYRDINLSTWWQAFSVFRHSIVHRNLLCTDEDYLKNKKLTDLFFPVTKYCSSSDCKHWRYNISNDILSENLVILGEYCFLITESLGNKYGFSLN